MPKISFVMPTHNRIEWMPEALQSILSQTESDIEVIVIDDASNDGTKEFMENWGLKDKRVVYLRNEEKKGAGYSRNLGAKEAKSDIIAIMDDDDACPQERAELILDWFKKNPNSEIVTFPYIQVGYCNEIIERFDGAEFNVEEYKKSGAINFFCNPSVAMKKSLALEIPYGEETKERTDDSIFVENLVKSGKKIDFSPGYYALMHRVLPKSMMADLRGFDPKWVTQ